MDLFDWFILIIAGTVAIAVLQVIFTSRLKKSVSEKLERSGLSLDQKVISEDGRAGIGLDETNKKLIIATSTEADRNPQVYSYRDILSVEIFVDGNEITKTSRTSQLGGALLGGLALGGIGAIIGGLSGSTKTSKKTNRIDMRLVLNDKDNPIHDISFMNTESEPGGVIYEQAMKAARHWHGLMTVLIKEADREDESVSNAPTANGSYTQARGSVASELEKLEHLRSTGILSDKEFADEKRKLLER